MSVLSGIKESVQQVAEAISIAVGVEVEIVDNKLRILGGTGVYQGRIGKKEEGGDVEGNYLYARVLRTGKTQYVADAQNDKGYDRPVVGNTRLGELAEICKMRSSASSVWWHLRRISRESFLTRGRA